MNRTLRIGIPKLGLANRLRVLVSAMILAEDLRSRLVVDWTPSPSCNASLRDVVRGFDEDGSSGDVVVSNGIRLSVENRSTVQVYATGQFAHENMSCQEYFARKQAAYKRILPEVVVPELVGLHVRKFDATYDWPVVAASGVAQRFDDDVEMHFVAAERVLAQRPGAKLFVASNDLNVKRAALRRFGDRALVAIGPTTRDKHGVYAALVDLAVLSRASLILHTFGSSFGEEAAAATNTPSVRLRRHGHVVGVDLDKPNCHHPLFHNLHSKRQPACYAEGGRRVCAPPLTLAPCRDVPELDAYCLT